MPREGDIDPQNPEKSKDHQCIGISRGGRSTKIHAVVDALGNPLHIQLSAGNVNDVTVAQDLLRQHRIGRDAAEDLREPISVLRL